MTYEGKLFGVETTEDLEGNNIWNRLHVETKNQLIQKLSLNDGDYLWLAIGDDDEKTVMYSFLQLICSFSPQGNLCSLLLYTFITLLCLLVFRY